MMARRARRNSASEAAGEYGRDQIAVRGASGEGRRQCRRDYAGHQEAESNEPERVRDHQRKERVVSRHYPKPRPDEEPGDQPEGHEAQENAESE
jgi:hypothetical protein